MYRRILVPLDLNEVKHAAIPVATEYAQAFEASLHVLTVLPDFGKGLLSQFFTAKSEERMMEAAHDALQAVIRAKFPSDVAVEAVVAQGNVYENILGQARTLSCDLIVMAAHKPDIKDYLLGPNAARVVRHAECSVLVVRSESE